MYKGKGIIFAGCSYTWGGGLEYYPPFKDIPNPYAFQYDENKISFARQAFNDSVTTYNNSIEMFPSSVIASMFAFQPAALLEIQNPVEKEAPRVSF